MSPAVAPGHRLAIAVNQGPGERWDCECGRYLFGTNRMLSEAEVDAELERYLAHVKGGR